MIITEKMIEAGAIALKDAEATHPANSLPEGALGRYVPWIEHAARAVIEAAMSSAPTPPATAVSEPVAWLHPTAGWASESRQKILIHCLNNGPFPIPLYAAPVPAREAVEVWQPIETAPRDIVILAAHSAACITVWWETTADDGNGGWTDGSTNRYDEYTVYPVTHWMRTPPLPGAALRTTEEEG